jgi:hypothetical protein
MIGLRPLRARGRTGQRSILLQRLVVLFDLPPFLGFILLVQAHHTVTLKCYVSCHQIQKALAAVFVRKDLFDQKQWKADLFQLDFLCFAVFE